MTDLQYLYKYRSLSGQGAEWTKSIVVDSHLHFANPLQFNDPFDSLPRRSVEASYEEKVAWLRKYVRKRNPHYHRGQVEREAKELVSHQDLSMSSERALEIFDAIFDSAKRGLGVLSLSARPDHVLLWSHYADCHQGICLRFVATDDTEFFGAAQEVIYCADRPVLNFFKQTIDQQIDTALVTKADFWSYEQEWRIFSHEVGPGQHPYPASLLDGIILGLRTPPDVEASVRSWVHDRHPRVELLRASMHPERFGLEIIPA